MFNQALFDKILGQVIPIATISAAGPDYAKYVSDFVLKADTQWTANGPAWAVMNYYDRAFNHYRWYKATGDSTWLDRARLLANDYLTNYLVPNNYMPSMYWCMPIGIALYYADTGNATAFIAISKLADLFANPYNTNNNFANLLAYEGREQARALEMWTLAILCNAPSVGVGGISAGNDFAALASRLILAMMATQGADGSRKTAVNKTSTGEMLDKPFMNGLWNEALIRYHELIFPVPGIKEYIKANLDYMWTNEWDAATNSFKYLNKPSTTEGAAPSPDLNGLISCGFAFLGDRARGDLVFKGGVNGAWLDGPKQFNQQYRSNYPDRVLSAIVSSNTISNTVTSNTSSNTVTSTPPGKKKKLALKLASMTSNNANVVVANAKLYEAYLNS